MYRSVGQNLKIHESIERHILRMPGLSTTMSKVMSVCNRPDTSANDLNRVISLDPVLTGQVLKLINSAYYSLRSEVTSLTRAIIILGLSTVKNIALSTVVVKSFGMSHTANKTFMDSFWAHSLCVGVTAKILAASNHVSKVNQEEYFVAGLLHDLGKIPLHAVAPDSYAQLTQMGPELQLHVCRAETRLFGVHHCDIGRIIAEKWNLGGVLKACLSFHHDPLKADTSHRLIVFATALADIFSIAFSHNLSEDNFSGLKNYYRISETAGIILPEFSELRNNVSKEIERSEAFLNIIRKS